MVCLPIKAELMRPQRSKQINKTEVDKMAWDLESTDDKVVVEVLKDGDTTRESFEPRVTIKEAVTKMARATGLKNFIVKDADGTEIDEDEGGESLSEYPSPITITAKAVGACQ